MDGSEDAIEVDTDQLRDKVANLSGLLVTTMSVVDHLRKTEIPPAAFGQLGIDVHAISRQVQDRASSNIAELAAVFQKLNRRSVTFAASADRIASRDSQRLAEIRAAKRPPGGR